MEKMLLVDLETQNYPVESGIYEVACLVIENYEVVDKLYLGKKIDGYKGKTTYGHGFHNIANDSYYINKFKDFLSKYNYPLVAHNCSFDRKFLAHYKWIDEDYPCYCSIQAVKKEVPGLPSYSMENLIKHFNIKNKANHTAMSDTECLLELLQIVKPKIWKKMGSSRKKTGNKGLYFEINLAEHLNEESKKKLKKINDRFTEEELDEVTFKEDPNMSDEYNEKMKKYKRMESLLDKDDLSEEEEKEYQELKEELLGIPLSDKEWFVYLMLFVFFPYGLWIMWLHKDIPLKTKGIITMIFIFAGMIGSSLENLG